jgi:hypothetical protein
MEMYSGAWALMMLYIIGGPLIGLFLPFISIPLAIYSLFTRKHRRGLIGSRIALALAITPLLFTIVMWFSLITGKYINGDPIDSRDESLALYRVVAVLDVIALITSVASWVRQRSRGRLVKGTP